MPLSAICTRSVKTGSVRRRPLGQGEAGHGAKVSAAVGDEGRAPASDSRPRARTW
jgi:hypothetical protein